MFICIFVEVAASIPYMVSIGNHEDSAGALAHFTERFRAMPSATSVPNTTTTTNGVAPNNWHVSSLLSLVCVFFFFSAALAVECACAEIVCMRDFVFVV